MTVIRTDRTAAARPLPCTHLAIVTLLAAMLAGCATRQASTPLPEPLARQGLAIERSLPKELPDESSPFPGSQLVLISTDSAAGMLVPVPFVAEAVVGAINRHEASQLAARYAALDPDAILRSAMQGSPVLARGAPGAVLHPLAYIVNCSDDLSRVALVARVQSASWDGRYMVHLPTTYPHAALVKGEADALAALRGDMVRGATVLRRMIEQDARGELSRPLYKADVGSMNLACSSVSGLVPARLMLAPNTDVVEEGSDYVIVRSSGDTRASGALGGLMFGLHYLRKDQLHTFRRR